MKLRMKVQVSGRLLLVALTPITSIVSAASVASITSVVLLASIATSATAEDPSGVARSLEWAERSADLLPPDPTDGFCGDVLLANHDGTAEGAYGWIFNGVAPPDYGAFAECFEGRFRVCEVQFYLTQVGHLEGQTMDVYVWSDLGNGTPGAVLAMVPDVSVADVAEWPATSRHDIEMSVLVEDDWWVGYWGNWPDAVEGWFLAADEDGSGGRPRTKIAPGIGYPTGWEHPDLVSSWAECKSLGIQVQGRDANPVGSPASAAPFAEAGVELEQRQGDCESPVLLKNHDGTVENAYSWVYTGVASPDYGAFAESFEGSYSVCEVQFFLTQIGGYAGQTMDVYLWDDSGVESPGAVLSMISGINPGAVAAWPQISQHNFTMPVSVSGRWWVGYWGDWPDAEAGWFVGADENGPGGGARTRIAPGIGYPTGWEHPSAVFAWEDCRSLAMQVVVQASSNVDASADSPWAADPVRAMPNPFVGESVIEFYLSAAGPVDLTIHDVTGRLVRVLTNSNFVAGSHQVAWDGTIAGGAEARAGVYYVRVRHADGVETRRVVKLSR